MSKANGYRMPINGLIPISQTNTDTGYQSMDFHQSPKTKTMIPDANQWTYTNLQGMIIGNNFPIAGLTIDSSQETNNKCNKQEETSCQ